MSDETKPVVPDASNQGDGGETGDNQTTANLTDAEKLAKAEKVAEDQRKRAEIAEAKLAEANQGKGDVKPTEETKTNQPDASSEFVTRDEAVLLARGYSDEAIAQAKKIAKGADVPLLDALKDPLMVAFLEKETEDKKKADAQLGASNGSGVTPEKGVPTDPEEHKKFWKEQMGK